MTMRKAVIIGGASGIGRGIAACLAGRGWSPLVLDRTAPAAGEPVSYRPFDLLDMDEALLRALFEDPEVGLLMVTAGGGRLSPFEALLPAEIDRLLTLNLAAPIRILRLFYPRIHGSAPFFTGVMSSFAGLVSSPLFSVYASAKAGVYRFAESVNAELAAQGISNRVFCAAPGYIPGTRFYGGDDDPRAVRAMAEALCDRLLASDARWIPDEEKTYGAVLARYREDPDAFGEQSYAYKQKERQRRGGTRPVVGYLSGTFDLFHVGHLNLLRRAYTHCDELIVGVHESGSWKGKQTYVPLQERKAMLEACRYVDRVVDAPTEDSDAWSLWHFDRLFVGSDYQGSERFRRYEAFFADKPVEIIYFPYTTGTSSTQIRQAIESPGGR